MNAMNEYISWQQQLMAIALYSTVLLQPLVLLLARAQANSAATFDLD